MNFNILGVLTDVLVRVVFFVLQCVLLVAFETKVHYFQQKLAYLLFANAALILFSVQVNPVFTYLGLLLIADPYFKR